MTSQSNTPELAPPVEAALECADFPTSLPETDGEPLDSDWHRLAINLLIEIVRFFFRGRRDFFAGGNMFLYFSRQQARNKDYRGPDFFFVWGVDADRDRPYWAVWEEDGKYPNVIVELLSASTENVDRTIKKTLYERTFRTPEYFLYDPRTKELEGWRLHTKNGYEPIEREESGRLWSQQLELYLGTWEGSYLEAHRTWLRFFDVHGNLILFGREFEKLRADELQQRANEQQQRANEQQQRADREQARAEQAEAELARLRQELGRREGK